MSHMTYHAGGDQSFVSARVTEYVDGEDLSSLLRRIGRLPSDKAIEIARQLCAGLAAAHDKGVPSGLTIHSESPACSKSRALQTTFRDLPDCSCEAVVQSLKQIRLQNTGCAEKRSQ
jgi:serine/threonine protein kinase